MDASLSPSPIPSSFFLSWVRSASLQLTLQVNWRRRRGAMHHLTRSEQWWAFIPRRWECVFVVVVRSSRCDVYRACPRDGSIPSTVPTLSPLSDSAPLADFGSARSRSRFMAVTGHSAFGPTQKRMAVLRKMFFSCAATRRKMDRALTCRLGCM